MPSNIKEIYELAIKKIDGGLLFGEKIDLNNPKHVAVALYLAGIQAGRHEGMEFLEYLEGGRISK